MKNDISGDEFNRELSVYDFKLSNGYLEVNTFAGMLRTCMMRDGIASPPSVADIVDLLGAIARDKVPQSVPYWSEIEVEPARHSKEVYPRNLCEIIHVAALTLVRELWIYNIGTETPSSVQCDESGYMGWTRPEWIFTRTFILRFHHQAIQIEIDSDRFGAKANGYSNFEALHVAVKQNIQFDEAVRQLKSRNLGFANAISRVDSALDAGFPLEAIVVVESLISSCLHHFLLSCGVARPPEALFGLIAKVNECGSIAQKFPTKLLDEVNRWRRSRNSAAHRFVARDPMEMISGQETFLKEARKTAIIGREIALKVSQWFHEESFYFLKTDFELKGPPIN